MITGQMVIDRLITSGLISTEDVSKSESERILKFFEKEYDIVTRYNGSWEVKEDDIILIKKERNKNA